MDIAYGFSATVTAKPGMGDQLIELLRSGLDDGRPASSEDCLLFLVSRSAANPDAVHVIEGWTSEEAHDREFNSEGAQAVLGRLGDIVAETVYTDFAPVIGKASF